jgi:hypothetical protein
MTALVACSSVYWPNAVGVVGVAFAAAWAFRGLVGR